MEDTASAIICAPHRPWPCEWAWAVVGCESGFQVDAVSPDGQHIGLFQVSLVHRWTREELLNPVVNVAAAAELYTRSGGQPWACQL